MGADATDTASSTDHSVVDDDGQELHKRKRALTRKVDLRILPLLSYVFYNCLDRMKYLF
jgi:hypothetical protein